MHNINIRRKYFADVAKYSATFSFNNEFIRLWNNVPLIS